MKLPLGAVFRESQDNKYWALFQIEVGSVMEIRIGAMGQPEVQRKKRIKSMEHLSPVMASQ